MCCHLNHLDVLPKFELTCSLNIRETISRICMDIFLSSSELAMYSRMSSKPLTCMDLIM